MKVVLIGGPCTGKTTTIIELEKRGHKVIHEAAREIIAEEIKKNPEFKSWETLHDFQIKILNKQLQQLKDASNELTFFDHGIPSGIAFFEVNGFPPPELLIEASKNNRYDKVLVLETLDKYETDSERKETKEKAEEIHEKLKKVYKQLNYELIEIPSFPLKERIELIEKIIKK